MKGINRFSEDIGFDCKDFSGDDFNKMTDEVLIFLKRFGFNVEIRDKENSNLTAFRRSYYFPSLLFELGLSGYKEERFLIKIECQDQLYPYTPINANIKGCGFYFSFPVPEEKVLCAMKISALLSRSKGRDFYDVMFLMNRTSPDYMFLKTKFGISNLEELKEALLEVLDKVNLSNKTKDFEHLLFEKKNSTKILTFGDYVNKLEEEQL